MAKEYVIVTPAYNEARNIEGAILSVLSQGKRPARWVIVDDGSTDDTPKIVQRYASEHDWIRYVRREKQAGQKYFASNVYAIATGIEAVRGQGYDYIGILDADITLPADYYATILGRMEQDDQLGIASGIYENLVNGKLEPVLNDRRSTPKAIMVFRRACYDSVGGFLPLEYGGEDTAACVMARMKGWKVWSYPDVKVVHHRPTGLGSAGHIMSVRFRQGICEYCLAAHPLFFLIKAMKRSVFEKPYVIGGMARLMGYFWGWLKGYQSCLPGEVSRYIRKEQLGRVIRFNAIEPKDQTIC